MHHPLQVISFSLLLVGICLGSMDNSTMTTETRKTTTATTMNTKHVSLNSSQASKVSSEKVIYSSTSVSWLKSNQLYIYIGSGVGLLLLIILVVIIMVCCCSSKKGKAAKVTYSIGARFSLDTPADAESVAGASGISGVSGVSDASGVSGVSDVSGVSGISKASNVHEVSGASSYNATSIAGPSTPKPSNGSSPVPGTFKISKVAKADASPTGWATSFAEMQGPIKVTGPSRGTDTSAHKAATAVDALSTLKASNDSGSGASNVTSYKMTSVDLPSTCKVSAVQQKQKVAADGGGKYRPYSVPPKKPTNKVMAISKEKLTTKRQESNQAIQAETRRKELEKIRRQLN